MFTQLVAMLALATIQASELDVLFPDLLLKGADGPPAMCGLSATTTSELAAAVRAASQLRRSEVKSELFEVYNTADRTQEFVLTREGHRAHPAVACREIRNQDGQLLLTRKMNCSGDRSACNQLFLEFRSLDSQLKGVPTDNSLSVP